MEELAAVTSWLAGRVAEVAPDDLTKPTPCSEWDVAALLAHIAGGNRMSVALLDGCDARTAGKLVTTGDPADVAESLEAQLTRFADADLDAPVHHPVGDVPARMLYGFRISDLLLHGWDLARAVGQDDTLDPRLLQWVWDDSEPIAVLLPASGLYGSGPTGTDGDLQTKVLDRFGRTP